jgi:diguanylate cyclase (GGDEF)-like protein/PAS domain S-box-containing protein
MPPPGHDTEPPGRRPLGTASAAATAGLAAALGAVLACPWGAALAGVAAATLAPRWVGRSSPPAGGTPAAVPPPTVPPPPAHTAQRARSEPLPSTPVAAPPAPAAPTAPPAPAATADADHARLVSQMRAVLEHASVGLVITIERRMVIVSRAFCRMFGYDEAELIGQPGRLIYPSDEAYADVGPALVKQFAERGQFDAELQMRRRDGSLFWCQVTGRPVDPGSAAAGTMWVLFDISDMRAQREQLQWASSHDPLTGLANRAGFHHALDQLLVRQPVPGRGRGAVLLLDLDHFKAVNDNGGHAAGDQLLCDLGAVMMRRVRQSDLVARLGGDEFAVLLDQCDLNAALQIADGIRGQIADYRLDWRGTAFAVGVSIGVVAIEPDSTRQAVLERADAACYAAKRAGRNAVRCWDAAAPGPAAAGSAP